MAVLLMVVALIDHCMNSSTHHLLMVLNMRPLNSHLIVICASARSLRKIFWSMRLCPVGETCGRFFALTASLKQAPLLVGVRGNYTDDSNLAVGNW